MIKEPHNYLNSTQLVQLFNQFLNQHQSCQEAIPHLHLALKSVGLNSQVDSVKAILLSQDIKYIGMNLAHIKLELY